MSGSPKSWVDENHGWIVTKKKKTKRINKGNDWQRADTPETKANCYTIFVFTSLLLYLTPSEPLSLSLPLSHYVLSRLCYKTSWEQQQSVGKISTESAVNKSVEGILSELCPSIPCMLNGTGYAGLEAWLSNICRTFSIMQFWGPFEIEEASKSMQMSPSMRLSLFPYHANCRDQDQ